MSFPGIDATPTETKAYIASIVGSIIGTDYETLVFDINETYI